MDLWDYFQQRRQKCVEASLVPIGEWEEMFSEDVSSGGKVGIMLGYFQLRDDAVLKIYERVAPGRPGGDIHRLSYAYFLTVGGREIWGRERDPRHDPPEHGHALDHERIPAGRITLQDAIREAWEALDEYDRRPTKSPRSRLRRRRGG